MKSIYVTTPDNIQVEYRLAGAGSRVGAAVIDTFVQVLVFVAITLITFGVMYDFQLSSLSIGMEGLSVFAAILVLSYFIIFFGYFLVLEIVMKGQTLGKRVFGLRCIRQNGQPITFVQSIIRNVIRVIIDNMGIGLVTMLFSKNHRRVGDMLAGTIVISENPSKYSSKSLTFSIGQVNTEKQSTIQSYPLESEEYEILKDYFARKEDFFDNGLYSGFRVHDYFAKKYNLNIQYVTDGFLHNVMNDNAGEYN